jgi:hypothetical protein
MSLHNPSLWDRLIAQRILHLWDTHVGDPTQKLPLTDKDKLAFARAVLQASSSDSADQIRKLREALEGSEQSLFGAWQMLEAICESDPSQDRKKAATRAMEGLKAARAALKEAE